MKYFYCLLLYALLLHAASAQSPLKWDYPCKPGTDCWNALTSVDERQTACQIKGIDLNTLSTEELLLITMEHPFFQSYVFHDSPSEGLGFAVNGFNGYQEFVTRKDAVRTLVEVYEQEDFTNVLQISDTIEIGEYTMKWTGVELLMMNPALLDRMSREESIHYLKRLHIKLIAKRQLNEFFGGTSFAASALIYYRLATNLGFTLSPNVLELDGFELFKTKLIVTNNRIIELLLDDFDRYVKRN
jgi:hypothetical protein